MIKRVVLFISFIYATNVNANFSVDKYTIIDIIESPLFSEDRNDKLIIIKSNETEEEGILVYRNQNSYPTYQLENIFNPHNSDFDSTVTRNINATINDHKLILEKDMYNGYSISQHFEFVPVNNNLILESGIYEYGTVCNTYTVTKKYILDSDAIGIDLKDFKWDFFDKNNQKNWKLSIADFELISNLILKFKNNKIKLKEFVENHVLVYKDNNLLCEPYRYMSMYENYNVYPKSITETNNLAYFLSEVGYNKEAVYLLENIIKFDRDRIVAYINLGDAYWELNEKKSAIISYQIYIELMKKNNKEHRIPNRVLERIEEAATL